LFTKQNYVHFTSMKKQTLLKETYCIWSSFYFDNFDITKRM